MRRPIAVVAIAASFLAASASNAHAYCRTTDQVIPADYNAVESGCLGGMPLEWASMPVEYQVYEGASSQISFAEANAVADQAFAHWPAASCSATDTTKHPALEVQNSGPTDATDPCTTNPCNLARDAVHGIYFRDQSWPYDDSANAIALTTVTYGTEDGHIFAAVMELNSATFTFSTSDTPPADAYSLEAVMTHEAGHFVGMAHSNVEDAIMYAYYGGTSAELTADDEEGVCAIYPPGSSSSSGCSCGLSPAAAGGWPLSVVGLLGVAAWRRRKGSRPGGPLQAPLNASRQ